MNAESDQFPPRPRRARGLSNDQKIFDSAIALIVEKGVDGFGAREVAALTGLTHGAVYGRYTGVNELFADLWERRLASTFREIARIAAEIGAAPQAVQVPDLLAEPPTISGKQLSNYARPRCGLMSLLISYRTILTLHY